MATLGLRWVVLFALVLSLMLPAVGLAQGEAPFQPSESELIFAGKVGDTIQRTFELVLLGEPANGLELSVDDLKDGDGVIGILATDIGIDPMTIDVLDATRRIVVTVNGTQKPGSFFGDLTIRMAGNDVAVVKLAAEIRAAPEVDTADNSKTVVLSVVSAGLPFGVSKVDMNVDPLNSTVISLVQRMESPAKITGANMLALRRADGETLPADAVSVTDKLPIEIAGHGGASLTLAARGSNLRAGEYSGLLMLQVQDQATALEVPVTVRVKDGFWLAFLVLLIGPLIGGVLKFRGGQGQVLIDVVARVEKLRKAIRPDSKGTVYLAANQRSKIDALVQNAMSLIQSGETVEVIEPVLAEAESMFKEYSEAVQIWLKENLTPMEQKAAEMAQTDPLCRPWVDQLALIRTGFKNGQVASMQTAQAQLEKVSSEMTAYQQKSEDVFDEGSLSGKGLFDDLISDEGFLRGWGLYRLRLNSLRIIAFLIAYLFSLAVGWVTIYMAKPTFGADVQDYMTLLLWSATSTVIGGQVFDLKSIYSQVQTEAQESPSGLLS